MGHDLEKIAAKQSSLGKPGGKEASMQDNDETIEKLKEDTTRGSSPRRPDWKTSPCTCLIGRPIDPRKSSRRPGITSSVIVI